MKAITVSNLTKTYHGKAAIDNTSFDVEAGSFFALLGTNGAGKSTTINCLTTIVAPTAGNIEVNGLAIGQDNDAIRRAIGVVFQSSLLDDLLTVRENLQVRQRFYHLPATADTITSLADQLDLSDFLDQPYGILSGGQKRRADIARALIHQPKILFLDEPTAGLDPESRNSVWETIKRLQATTKLTVFFNHALYAGNRASQSRVRHG